MRSGGRGTSMTSGPVLLDLEGGATTTRDALRRSLNRGPNPGGRGAVMIFGKHMFWRLLSPLAALLWVSVTLGFAGPDHADDTTGAHVAPHATSHAAPALPDQAADAAAPRGDSANRERPT